MRHGQNERSTKTKCISLKESINDEDEEDNEKDNDITITERKFKKFIKFEKGMAKKHYLKESSSCDKERK